MNNKITIFLSTLILSAAALPALASPVVWDWSPMTTGGIITNNYLTNQNPGQHFAEKVSFTGDTTISGIDIYNGIEFGSVGDLVKITIWGDSAGLPGSLLAQFSSNISIIDNLDASLGNHRNHADFSGFALAANTNYWIGMAAGSTVSFTQTGLSGVLGGDSKMAQFNSGDSISQFSSNGDMAFKLYGDTASNPVPEPAMLGLIGIGLAALSASRRKRAK